MFQQTYAIVRNTFFESIRQPIMLVVLVIATLLIIISNPLSGYTMSNDQKMLIDVGLATVFISGAVLAAFIATSVLGREIENRTALTVISKPVNRPLFVLGKYLGVAGALVVATLYMSFVFALVEQHKVLQTVRDPVHVPVVLFGLGAAIIGLGVGIWCNYFYNKVFTSTVICTTTPLAGLAYILCLNFKFDFSHQSMSESFNGPMWIGLASITLAILVLTAVAIAASTRLGQVMTLCITVGIFMMGMLSDWFIGRPLARMHENIVQKISSADETEIRGMLSQDDIELLRAWTMSLYSDHALHEFSVWPCKYQHALNVYQTQLELKSLSEAERVVRMSVMENQHRDDAAAKLANELEQARQAADAIHWPPAKDDLVHDLDWPLTVPRTNGECDTTPHKETYVFPPLLTRAASREERLSSIGYQLARSIIPNFQVLWLSDAITQDRVIPASYLVGSTIYGTLHIFAALSLAVMLFQRREVG